ncbi:hypothetical protein BT67DRAFT_50178 [Trichocladium antarcticum]|uniref:Uncharacterized protein n=1 Tax=Trichocladium antarcticum TaxID=1450529 RepID=A0AAN6UI35_9PEZI|nr:hypothetical protein BT67DRAFT_50178 [Trichocladium antarcticum]
MYLCTFRTSSTYRPRPLRWQGREGAMYPYVLSFPPCPSLQHRRRPPRCSSLGTGFGAHHWRLGSTLFLVVVRCGPRGGLDLMKIVFVVQVSALLARVAPQIAGENDGEELTGQAGSGSATYTYIHAYRYGGAAASPTPVSGRFAAGWLAGCESARCLHHCA